MSSNLLVGLWLLLLASATGLHSAELVERSTVQLDYNLCPKRIPAVDKWTRGGYIRAATFEATFYKLNSADSSAPPYD